MIYNPLLMNEWDIKKFVSAVAIINLAFLIVVVLGVLGCDVPILRQVLGFIYLSFIPGIIILRLLNIRNIGAVKTLLYSVGLSLAFNMFLGFFINMVYPKIGVLAISHPISVLPLIITWTVVLGLLCLIAYLRDIHFSTNTHLKVDELMSPPLLMLVLLPLLVAFGSLLLRYYQMNIVLVVVLFLVAIVPILVMITRLFFSSVTSMPSLNPLHNLKVRKIAQSIMLNFSIPERLYPLAIYCVALALLWHHGLPFKYLVQFDSFLEYYFSNLVAQSGHWNWTIAHNYNAMLSITILPATFSQLLGISLTALYQLVYPFWYALVPLGLYEVYRRHFSGIQSFLAVYFFMSVSLFFLDIPAIGRQMVAELFFVLLLMLVLEGKASVNRKVLFTIFGAGLVVSHYSLSYIYLALMFVGLIVMLLLRRKSTYVAVSTVTFLTVVCLAWYMYVSSSEPLATVVNMAHHISQGFITELLNPTSRDLSHWVLGTAPNALVLTYWILWYLMLLFMIVGATTLVSDLRRNEGRKEYSALAIGNFILLGMAVVIPFVSGALGGPRTFHIASLILAPYCILGIEMIFYGLSRAARSVLHTCRKVNWEIATTAILVLFFLFNSHLPMEISNSPVGRSLPLAVGQVRSGDTRIDLEERIWHWSASPTEQEVSSAEWLSRVRNVDRYVWGTHFMLGIPALVSYGMIPLEQTGYLNPKTVTWPMKDDYIYLGYVNVILGYGTTRALPGQPDPIMGDKTYWPIYQVFPLLANSAKIYSNGASEIYRVP